MPRKLFEANQLLSKLGPSSDSLTMLTMSLLMKREAVQSSRMEGTWSTIDHVLTPQDHIFDKGTLADRSTVIGYARALDKLSKKIKAERFSAFNIDLVKEVHEIILKDDPNFQGRAGEIREPGKPGEIVFIGGRRPEDSIFNPPLPQHVHKCLSDVMNWYADQDFAELGDAGMGLTLPERMSIGHSHFEGVHPFPDGNGRVGRIMMSLQMVASQKQPLYLSGFIEAEKTSYRECLQAAQKKLDYRPMVEFISEAILSSYQESQETLRVLNSLPQTWKDRGIQRSSSAQDSLTWLIGHPIFTVQQFADKFQITFAAAGKAVAKLEENKIVRERTGKKRNRLFAAEEVVQILGRDFGVDAELSLDRAHGLLGLETKW